MRDRVLVVDDNRDAADTLANAITAFGYEAKAVYDGNQAIAEAATFLPDMALIDIGMPGLDGYETVSRLRQQRVSTYIIMVAVTGWTGEQHRRRAYDCGFDLYIVKPMSVDTLRELLALLDPAVAKLPQDGGAFCELVESAEPKKWASQKPAEDSPLAIASADRAQPASAARTHSNSCSR
jgi:DNA-binding response OmpR family regulator